MNVSHSFSVDLFDFTEKIMTEMPVSLLCSYALCGV